MAWRYGFHFFPLVLLFTHSNSDVTKLCKEMTNKGKMMGVEIIARA